MGYEFIGENLKIDKIYLYKLQVNFEDVDWGGVVHHPNYLKYLERARIFAFSQEGLFFQNVIKFGYGIVVSEMRLKYLKPLEMGMNIYIYSQIVGQKKSSLKLNQIISTQLIETSSISHVLDMIDTYFQCQMRLVWVDLKTGKAVEPPSQFSSCLSKRHDEKERTKSDTRLDL